MSTEMLPHIPVIELVTSLTYDFPVWLSSSGNGFVIACPSTSVVLAAGHLSLVEHYSRPDDGVQVFLSRVPLGVTGLLGFFHEFHTAPVCHLPVLSRDMQHVSSFLHGGLDGGTL